MPTAVVHTPVPGGDGAKNLDIYTLLGTGLVETRPVDVIAPGYGAATFTSLAPQRYRAVLRVGLSPSIVDHVTIAEAEGAVSLVDSFLDVVRVPVGTPIGFSASTWCDRESLDMTFGSTNVEQWLDIENTGRGTPVLEEYLERRLGYHIALAVDMTRDALRQGPYNLPELDATDIPLQLRQVTTGLCGVLLYEGRGVNDGNEDGNHNLSHHRKRWEAFVNGVNNGVLRLTLSESQETTGPVFVTG